MTARGRPARVWVLAAAAATASCGGPQNMMAAAGPSASRIAGLGWFVLAVFGAVTAVMWGIVFRAAARRRGTLAEHLPWDAPEDRRWILVGGFTIPVIILATIFVLMLRSMGGFPTSHAGMASPSVDLRVVGHQWWWEVQYLADRPDREVVTANEVHIPVGRPVDVELQSRDVIHSFWVPRLHGKVDLVPGYVNRIRLQADQPGVFRGQCAEYCGPQHAHMALVVVAEDPALYAAWLERLRAPAAGPPPGPAARGEQVFMSHQCALCHTVRGTPARGLVGPDLTHVAGRAGIAANTLPNTKGALAAWATNAQSLKPHARMPTITAFTGDELQALTEYLQSLK